MIENKVKRALTKNICHGSKMGRLAMIESTKVMLVTVYNKTHERNIVVETCFKSQRSSHLLYLWGKFHQVV
jgi:hypothetical protein